jgi:phosphoribosyl-AMP cyclohydrolase
MQDLLDFAKGGGLIPVVVQDVTSNKILMLRYMNLEAFEETVRTQRACYYSSKRQRLWRKGEESGNVQLVRNILIDCDNDTVLIKVEQIGGAACHTGYRSCFYQELVDGELKVIEERIFDPNDVYRKKGT